jgi:hypothetical protein
MPTERGKGINCFGLFTRRNQAIVATSENSMTAEFVVEQLERCLDLEMIFRYRMFMFDNYFSK